MEENKDWYKGISLKSGEEMQIAWWNPAVGKYDVTFLAEAGNEYEVTFDKKTRVKIPFKIKVDGVIYTLGVTKATSETSLYGQLVKLAMKYSGITDVTTEILVQGIKKDRKYTIPEVINFDPYEIEFTQ